MKSSIFLQTQLRLRRDIEAKRVAAFGGEPNVDTDPYDYFAHRRGVERMQQLADEIASLPSETLEFAFEGHGIYGNAVTLRRLEFLVGPLGQTIRWTSRDLARREGVEVSGTVLAAMSEPVLVETVPGSFGVRIARSPVEEQTSLLAPVLFDRAAERIMSVFRVARDTSDAATVLDELGGLGANAIAGFRDLALQIATTGRTRVRWKGEEVVAVTPTTAGVVIDALAGLSVDEEPMVLVGALTGGDVADERFHLIVSDPESGRERHYRGNVEPEVLTTLRSLTFGSQVEASITEIRTQSQLFSRPRLSYILTAIRVVGAAT